MNKTTLFVIFTVLLISLTWCQAGVLTITTGSNITIARTFGHYIVMIPDDSRTILVHDMRTDITNQYPTPSAERYSFISGEYRGELFLYSPRAGHIRSFDPASGEFDEPVANSQYCEKIVEVGRKVFCGGAYAANFPTPAGTREPVYVYRLAERGSSGEFIRWKPVYHISQEEFDAGLMQPRFFLGRWQRRFRPNRLLICDSIVPVIKVVNPRTGRVVRQIGTSLADESPTWPFLADPAEVRAALAANPLNQIVGYSRVNYVAANRKLAVVQVRGLDGAIRTRLYRLSDGRQIEETPRQLLFLAESANGKVMAVQELSGRSVIAFVLEEKQGYHPGLREEVRRWETQTVLLGRTKEVTR